MLNDAQSATLRRLADVLIPSVGSMPAATAAPGFDEWLAVALRARADVIGLLAATLDGCTGDPEDELRRLDAEDPAAFAVVASIVAGTYYMIPEIRDAIGYPGPHREPPDIEQAVDDIMDIIDVVVERGPLGPQVAE
jgi:hypothetical protein